MFKIYNKLNAASLILLSASLLTIQSCSKTFLDVPPQAKEPVTEFWQSSEDATKAVNAMYANLRSWDNVAFAAIAVESMGSDEAEKGSSAGDMTEFNNYHTFTHSSTDGQIEGFWKGQYQNINLANQVLDNIVEINMDAGLKNRYLAEAKFVRAYSYFRLVRAFGDLPLFLTTPKDPDQYNVPRSPKEEVWQVIEKDLKEAIEVLPATYGPTDVGRVTKGAGLSLLAKVSMYQNKWAEVLQLTNQVKSLGYSLFPNFEASFRIPNENNSESIFEIQSQLIQSIPGASNSQYSQVQGTRGVPWGGWGFNIPSQVLEDAFEPNDPRKDATILFRGETTPQGDVIPTDTDNPRYNQKAYVPSSYYVDGFNQGADQNIRVIRYADVLLMNAEAANELGDPATALKSLNEVRARARGNNPSILPDVTTTEKGALQQAIWHERRVELAMEFDRFFDVIRQGRGKEVFGVRGFKEGKNELMPIPQNQVSLSGGILTQNPGY